VYTCVCMYNVLISIINPSKHVSTVLYFSLLFLLICRVQKSIIYQPCQSHDWHNCEIKSADGSYRVPDKEHFISDLPMYKESKTFPCSLIHILLINWELNVKSKAVFTFKSCEVYVQHNSLPCGELFTTINCKVKVIFKNMLKEFKRLFQCSS